MESKARCFEKREGVRVRDGYSEVLKRARRSGGGMRQSTPRKQQYIPNRTRRNYGVRYRVYRQADKAKPRRSVEA